MYTEDFENIREAEMEERRRFEPAVSQAEAGRLATENEKLRKSLEQEKFFSKLVDKELKELKSAGNPDNAPAGTNYSYNYYGRNGVSKKAFLAVCLFAFVMTGFVAYTLFYNKQYNLFGPSIVPIIESVPVPLNAAPVAAAENIPAQVNTAAVTVPENDIFSRAEAQTKKDITLETVPDPTPAAAVVKPVIKERVPEIVENKKIVADKKEAVAAPVAEINNKDKEIAVPKPAGPAVRPSGVPPAALQETRAVIAQYQVNSKANFYTAADENTLRSAFISPGNKTVDALEDRNGFIFVIYKNEMGFTTKGWLSKKDLTKVQ